MAITLGVRQVCAEPASSSLNRASLMILIDRTSAKLIVLHRAFKASEICWAECSFRWLSNPGAKRLRFEIQEQEEQLARYEVLLAALGHESVQSSHDKCDIRRGACDAAPRNPNFEIASR
jgi:hypothetical protein